MAAIPVTTGGIELAGEGEYYEEYEEEAEAEAGAGADTGRSAAMP